MTAMTHDGRTLRLLTLLDDSAASVLPSARTALREIRGYRDLSGGNCGAWRA
jgi:hypothetical protein